MKVLLVLPLAAILLSGCVVVPLGHRSAYYDGGRNGYYDGGPSVIVPAPVVRPYYRQHHRGYWYRH